MEEQKYELKSYVLSFISRVKSLTDEKEELIYKYKNCSDKTFSKSILESLLKERIKGNALFEEIDKQKGEQPEEPTGTIDTKQKEGNDGKSLTISKEFKVRFVVHSHKDFSIGQVSIENQVASFAQDFFVNECSGNDQGNQENGSIKKDKSKYLPTIHITLDDSYAFSLYSLYGKIKEGQDLIDETKILTLGEKLPSQISRSYQILDSSIWNKIVPFEEIVREEDGCGKRHIAGGTEGLFNAITEIDINYQRGLYNLGVAHEYANLNARLTKQAFLSGAHASGVSPFIFHSESATKMMIEKEFRPKSQSMLKKIALKKWRILLVDDKAFSTMGSEVQSIRDKEDGLYSNCKIKIIKNLLEEQFKNIKVEYRSCNKGFREPALYIWPNEKNNSSSRSDIIKIFESNDEKQKQLFDKSCLYDIKSSINKQNDQQLSSTNSESDEGNKICHPKESYASEMWQKLVALFWWRVRKSSEAYNIDVHENVDQMLNNKKSSADENQEVIGYKYVGDHLLDIKSIIDEKSDGVFSTEIETIIDDATQFLIEYAETLDEAEEALRSKKYDFVLLDYLLNNEYGYELLDRIYSYTEAERIYKESDWKKIIGALISDAPSQEFDELLRYLAQRGIQEEKKDKKCQNNNIIQWLNEINEIRTELKSLIESSNKGDKEDQGKIKKLENEITRIIGQILEEDKYKFGPYGRFFFLFISAYTSAVYERLLAEGLNRSEKYWHIAVGACPTNTPQLFMYNLLKLMEKRLEDSGIEKISVKSIYHIVNEIYSTKPGIRHRANDYYQEVLDMQYYYRKMLDDVQFPADGNIFNTTGSVLITDFIGKNVYLGGLLEHLTQLVHLTAFGTVRQWPEMWEEYIYFKSQFNISLFVEEGGTEDAFYKLCADIENYIIDLKSDRA